MTRVINLLYVNLGLALLQAALTFVFYGSLVAYQAHGSAAAYSVFENTTWIRPVAVSLVSLIYVGIARKLRSGSRATYIRVVVISVIGSLGLAWAISLGQFPVWMEILMGAQALVLVGLFISAMQPSVRAQIGKKAAA
ncbi:hypothetical protein [Kutzneria sp. CA-103260]|uniref:hypothetical protein n=1 Tax=Kutzneria sp. CA-103260 TaxID=2802641 RepID=UPI001BAA02D4|nr:hypothetical protein [Kutzneria sp. CA-103260]QUQ70925.1 hypothetical protein JJ691_87080 [Kutzneria sp. CA-103260]